MMQPLLNPTFTWNCWQAGGKTVCDGERHLQWTAEDTGLPCGATTVHSTGTDDRFARRTGDAQGRALHTHFVADIRETLALNPEMTGTTASAFGHFSERFRYGVPGETSSRIVVMSGNDITVVARGTGLVLHDVGVKAFDSDDEVVFAHGPHPLLQDFEGTFAKVCHALQR